MAKPGAVRGVLKVAVGCDGGDGSGNPNGVRHVFLVQTGVLLKTVPESMTSRFEAASHTGPPIGNVMSVLRRTRSTPEPSAPAPATPMSAVDELSKPLSSPRAPRTRISAAWFGICAAAAGLVILIVFMLQNTGSVDVHFLWMDGSLPLALALFIAGVAATIVATAIGAARITQLRRLVRRRRTEPLS
ncbi:LapA family protein [Kribbella turkmenica]|uniref:LapA family protein n=1 Tax=Kribbella turkmenica TaxID=2530375 RepID=UPI001404F0E2|nr:lipopolysaccharide assembly protein LapA domain-containing protein [Kribbella turkmenica]